MSGCTALYYQYQSTKRHCRFCATELNFNEVMDLSTKDTLVKYTKLVQFLQLNVDLSENTKLPRYTCYLCHNKVIESYNFFLKVKQSQDVLRSLYEDNKVVIESTTGTLNEETSEDKMKSETVEISNDISETVDDNDSIVTYADVPLYNNEIGRQDVHEHTDNISDDDHITVQSECEVYLDKNIEKKTSDQNPLEMNESWSDVKNSVEVFNISFDKSKVADVDSGKTLDGRKHTEISNNELEFEDHMNTVNEAKDNSTDGVMTSVDNPTDGVTTSVDNPKDAEIFWIPDIIDVPDTDPKLGVNSKAPITYAGIPLFIDEDDIENNEQITESEVTQTRSHNSDSDDDDIVSKVDDNSWASYPWSCDHCKADCESMEDVRAHSRYTHHYCCGFRCVDCNDDFNRFSSFVEHVRMHREYLRFFCQFCNEKFQDKRECFEHSLTHWSAQKICEHCGEMFPDQIALITHQKQSWRKRLKKSTVRKKPKLVFPATFVYAKYNVFEDEDGLGSWKDYEWTCLDCYKVEADIQNLRNHIQEVHSKCFAMKCSDCLMVTNSFHMFVKHVHEHRPHLRNYCQYCNEYLEDLNEMKNHIESHLTSAQKPCFGCGQTFQNLELLRQHITNFNAPRKLGSTTAEEATCDICHKTFKSISIMKSHKVSHNKKENSFICDVCGKGFHSQSTLSGHLQSHGEKSEKCEICQRKFKTKRHLKNHAKLHLEDRPYTCDHCGRSYKKRYSLVKHLKNLAEVKRHKCRICKKEFRFSGNLKVHFNQHLGITFCCKFCDKVFNNLSNMNKHMKRIHGTSHFKSKEGSMEKIALNEKEKEWLSKVTTKKRGKKT